MRRRSSTSTRTASREIRLEYDPAKYQWSIKEGTATRVFDDYSFPTSEHWLGTDKNGMDMLTRLMYGGRVSLCIGFIVVFISATLGVILGGVSGYFGGWVDNLIMRIVDIFTASPPRPSSSSWARPWTVCASIRRYECCT